MPENIVPGGWLGPGGFHNPDVLEGYLSERVTNVSGIVLARGTVVRISANDSVTTARADAAANLRGLAGVMLRNTAIGAADEVVTEGKCFVLLEAGLPPFVAGDPLWVSAAAPAGRATTVEPVLGAYLGIIKDTTDFAVTGGVVADIDPYGVLSSDTLRQTYNNGVNAADQTMTITDANGGGITILGHATAVGNVAFTVDGGTYTDAAGGPRINERVTAIFAPIAGAVEFQAKCINYTINQTAPASGMVTGLLVYGTETAALGRHELVRVADDSNVQFKVYGTATGGGIGAPTIVTADIYAGGLFGTEFGGATGALSSLRFFVRGNSSGGFSFRSLNNYTDNADHSFVALTTGFVPIAATYSRGLSIAYTIDQTAAPATGPTTGIYLRATETFVRGAHNLLDLGVGVVNRFLVDRYGNTTITQVAVAGGTPTAFTVTRGAHTAVPNAEIIDTNIDLTNVVTFAGVGGGVVIPLQRAVVFRAPRYDSTLPLTTITTAATVAILGPPSGTANCVLSNTLSLYVQSGNVGIGTGNPLGLLHVIGDIFAQRSLVAAEGAIIEAVDTTTYQMGATTGYKLIAATTTPATVADRPGVLLGFDTSAGGIVAAASDGAGKPLAFWTHNGTVWAEKMRLTAAGFFGIGVTPTSTLHVVQVAATTGSPTAFTLAAGAHTTLANAETNDVYLNLARVVQFTGGAVTVTNQRASYIAAPTYDASIAGMTLTNAATLYVSGAPVAGSGNLTITYPSALWIGTGQLRIGTAISSTADLTIANTGGVSSTLRLGTSTTRHLYISYTVGSSEVAFGTYGSSDYLTFSGLNLRLTSGTKIGANSAPNASSALDIVANATIPSAAGADWEGIYIVASTATITGANNITDARGFNLFAIDAPTLSAASAITITHSASQIIHGFPLTAGAGPAAITNASGLRLTSSVARTGTASGYLRHLHIDPTLTLTEPGAGTTYFYGADIDLSGLLITAGAGTSTVAALRLSACTSANVGTTYALDLIGNAKLTGGQIIKSVQVLIGVSPYTVGATDYCLEVQSNGGAITINLPALTGGTVENGRVIVIKDSGYNAAISNITIVRGNVGDKINNVAGSYTVTVSSVCLWLKANTTNNDWEII